MTFTESLTRLRDDMKLWVTNNLKALNAKIDEKTIPIDSELDITSTNPVQNKAIAEEISKLDSKIVTGGFSGEYSDIKNAPDIVDDSSGNLVIADKDGNVIFDVDDKGIHTTAMTINGQVAATEDYVMEALENFDDFDLSNYYNKSETDTVINGKADLIKKELGANIESDEAEYQIIDSDGNIIASINADGLKTTAVTTSKALVGGINISDELNSLRTEKDSIGSQVNKLERSLLEETWTFTLDDGSTITKRVVIK